MEYRTSSNGSGRSHNRSVKCSSWLKHAALFAGIIWAAAVVPVDAAPQLQDNGPIGAPILCQPDNQPSAADALQECIDRAPAFSTIEVPPGIYVLRHQIVISAPITIRTAGAAAGDPLCTNAPDQCATLVASPDLVDQWGLLVVRSTTHVRLEHLVIDGNRAARTASAAAQF